MAPPLKASFQPLAPPRRASSGYGWMTVNPQAPLWQELLAPGSRALAMRFEARGAYKLHIYPLANVDVPDDIQQLLDANAAAWASQDMDAVLALHHPAFKVTNQKDLAAMRKLFSHTRRYEWQVKELREDGDFAHLRGEIRTEAGGIPARARLFRENGRWMFYGDGGSWDRAAPRATGRGTKSGRRDSTSTCKIQAQEVLAQPTTCALKRKPPNSAPSARCPMPSSSRPGRGRSRRWCCCRTAAAGSATACAAVSRPGLAQGYVVMVVDSLRGHPNNCVAPLRVSFERRLKDAYDALEHLSKIAAGRSAAHCGCRLFAGRHGRAAAGIQANPRRCTPSRRRFAAGVAWYPLCYMSARYAKRKEFDFLRPDIDTPLLLLMGGEDIYTPAYDCVPHLEELQAGGAPVEWQVFPQAVHGWDLTEASGGSTFTFRGDRMTFSL